MLYSELKNAFSRMVPTGWPATPAENTTYDVAPMGSDFPVTIQDIENALAAELPGAPITAIMDAVPNELKAIATELLGKVVIAQFSVQTGLANGSDYNLRGFTISLGASSPSTTLCGLKITGYGLQLNFVLIGDAIVFSPAVYASVNFLNVDCGLEVGALPAVTYHRAVARRRVDHQQHTGRGVERHQRHLARQLDEPVAGRKRNHSRLFRGQSRSQRIAQLQLRPQA